MQKQGKVRNVRKQQLQARPGKESQLRPVPVVINPIAPGGKLNGKVVLITGGDSGIGRAIAVLFAREGARVAIAYLNEHADALETQRQVEEYHSECLLIAGDLSKEKHCGQVVRKTIARFGKIDVLINNAGLHWESASLSAISTTQLIRTFTNNVFPFFWVTQAALPFLKSGSSIINTTSVTAYRGSDTLMDYAATKGAIVSFTRSLSGNLVKKGIRVNAVAPGPVWTPLIASSFKPKKVARFGSDVPMERAGQPAEIAPAYLFLACEDSSYITGQVIHPNGGEIING